MGYVNWYCFIFPTSILMCYLFAFLFSCVSIYVDVSTYAIGALHGVNFEYFNQNPIRMVITMKDLS